jgi:hypothetical protein
MQRLETYQELKKNADYLAQWVDWREKALELLRKSITEKQRGLKHRWALPFNAGYSILVEIFLWERKFEDAWKEATLGGCSRELWLRLAEKRSKNHPAAAADVYLRYIEPAIQLTNNAAYHEAVELLRKVKELKGQLGRPEDFIALVETVRRRHKAKRNLMKLLHSEGW